MSRSILATGLALLALPPSSARAGQDAWTTIPLGTTEDIVAIENTSFSERYLVGTGGFVAQSSMNRTVWTPVDVGATADFTSIHQPSAGQVWIGGANGVVRRLVLGVWQGLNLPVQETFTLFSRSSGQSWAAGRDGSIYRTLDGVDWELSTSVAQGLEDGTGFVSSISYAVGDGGTVLRTIDSGATWETLENATSTRLLAVEAVSNAEYLVGGEKGLLMRTTVGGETPVEHTSWGAVKGLFR